ncbi:MAG: DUF1573 domain-containing protein [Marinilabiliaceae bacterium]
MLVKRMACLLSALTIGTAVLLSGCGGHGSTPSESSVQKGKVGVGGLSVDTTLIDLGRLSGDEVAAYAVKLYNRSGYDISVVEVSTDCSCLCATVDGSVVKAGSWVYLRLEFDTHSAEGKQYHSVRLKSTDGRETELCVFADVTPPVY